MASQLCGALGGASQRFSDALIDFDDGQSRANGNDALGYVSPSLRSYRALKRDDMLGVKGKGGAPLAAKGAGAEAKAANSITMHGEGNARGIKGAAASPMAEHSVQLKSNWLGKVGEAGCIGKRQAEGMIYDGCHPARLTLEPVHAGWRQAAALPGEQQRRLQPKRLRAWAEVKEWLPKWAAESATWAADPATCGSGMARSSTTDPTSQGGGPGGGGGIL